MARFIDDLRAAKKIGMPSFIPDAREAQWTNYAGHVLDLLRDDQLPVILADNVSEYYYAGTDQEFWGPKDFPNVAPPYESFWIEHRMPKLIHSKARGDTDMTEVTPRGRVGLLFLATTPEKVTVKGGWPDGVKWVYWCDMYTDFGPMAEFYIGPHSPTFFAVNAEGGVVDRPWIQSFAEIDKSDVMKTLMSWYNVGLLTITFLHCKNVRVDDTPVPPKLAKSYQKKHGFKPTAHKTLVIEPLKEILRREGRSQQTGLKQAMHICRGHFADYTEGRGLFGKIHGRFWIPMTIRGTKGKEAPAREIEVKL